MNDNSTLYDERTIINNNNMLNNNDNNNVKKIYKKIMIGIIIFVSIFIVGKLGLNYFYTHDSNKSVSSSVVFNDSMQQIKVSSYEFSIPSNLIVTKGDNYFTMKDEKNEYVVRIDIQDADFQHLLDHQSTFIADADSQYNSKAIVKEYNEEKYIVVDVGNWGSKTLTAFKKFSDNKILIISIINKPNTYDYGLLEKYSKIINDLNENTND